MTQTAGRDNPRPGAIRASFGWFRAFGTVSAFNRSYTTKNPGTNQLELSFPHFDSVDCLEKSVGKPPLISVVELGLVPHKVKADRTLGSS